MKRRVSPLLLALALCLLVVGAARAGTFVPAILRARLGADPDADLVPDPYDDCPYAFDPDPGDAGGIGDGSAPDGVGDACQCGDVDGDGRCALGDIVTIGGALLSPPTAAIVQACPAARP